jgi:malonate transporter
LHPLLVLGVLLLAQRLGFSALEPKLMAAAVLMAAMPMLGIYTILAQKYGQEARSAGALLLTTIVSFFSLSGLLWLIKFAGMLS